MLFCCNLYEHVIVQIKMIKGIRSAQARRFGGRQGKNILKSIIRQASALFRDQCDNLYLPELVKCKDYFLVK